MDDRTRAWAAYLLAPPWLFLILLLLPTRLPPALKIAHAAALAAYALAVPARIRTPHPLLDAGLRLCYGYLAMKALDLGAVRAHRPPVLRAQGRLPRTFAERLRYALHLVRETRYESFDISVAPPPRAPPSWRYHAAQYAGVALLNAIAPLAEARALGVVLAIYTVFELGHRALRPDSRTTLFDRPLAAPGLGAFWRKGWHAILLSPLSSLAFRPFGTVGGRGAGALAAFALSGAWHAWAVVPVGGTKLAGRVFAVFVAQAGWMSVEWALWGKQNTLVKRFAAWAWCLAWAGWALRGFDDRAAYWLPCI
jgi:hypothetical protein